MARERILLAGVTGYIGGSVLHQLLRSKHAAIKDADITCLVRGQERVAQLHAAFGDRVKVIGFEGLDDTDRLVEIASQYDVIFNMTLGYHLASAAAFIEGLSLRQKSTGKDAWMVHTSGVSNLADQPLSGVHVESKPDLEFDDSRDNIYAYEKSRNTVKKYIQRTTELGMIDAGLESGVKTVVLMSPLIYGVSDASPQTAAPHNIDTSSRLERACGISVVCKFLDWPERRSLKGKPSLSVTARACGTTVLLPPNLCHKRTLISCSSSYRGPGRALRAGTRGDLVKGRRFSAQGETRRCFQRTWASHVDRGVAGGCKCSIRRRRSQE